MVNVFGLFSRLHQ